MKTIKGKVGFMLILSIISLSILTGFNIFFLNKQNDMAKTKQMVQQAMQQSENIKYELMNTRFYEQQFYNDPSKETAEKLRNSIQTLHNKAKSYAESHQMHEEIAGGFTSIVDSSNLYMEELEPVIKMYEILGFNSDEGQYKTLNDTYDLLYSLVEQTGNHHLVRLVLEMRMNEQNYLETGNNAALNNFNKYVDQFNVNLRESDVEDGERTKISREALNYKTRMLSIRTTLESAMEIKQQFEEITSSVVNQVNQVTVAAEDVNNRMQKEQEELQQLLYILLISIGVIVLLLLLITGTFLIRSINRSIQTLKQGAEIMGSGDLAFRVDVKGKDEMSDLAASFNHMAEKMNQSLLKVRDAAKILGSSSSDLAAISQQTSSQAQEVNDAINQVAIGSQEQAGQIEESTTLIENVAKAIEQTESMKDEIIEALKNAESESQNGFEKMNQLENITKSFIELANHLTKEIQQATDQSNKINQIVSTIQEIADNTNLLALNAAIESARAGEDGRGFAVVADEVRKLAERSKNEAEEIYHLISQMTEQMNALSRESDKFNTYQEEQAVSVKETKNAFTSITEHIYDMNEKTDKIGTSLEEVRDANDVLKQKLHDISVISEEAVATAEEVAASSENQSESIAKVNESAMDLHALSQELEAEVSDFKLNENAINGSFESDMDLAEDEWDDYQGQTEDMDKQDLEPFDEEIMTDSTEAVEAEEIEEETAAAKEEDAYSDETEENVEDQWDEIKKASDEFPDEKK
ncbi:methyl-accepting chemotaxis protein [Melghiribacillus thermohalophilus]|uniref:Methyl-accepting chemotaxis protein n=1 Tax=Melghiribacillus thermohalophilus TaxID=1324956 RepID=A0A4V2V154_9BACI|nr:methyl-accepting chemotaxis protein [Melghiribacillus thermohalophilus]TCT19912.1 methyl-accepting chemotaxis protein [Melghiribacillus thermohalophilus]